MPRLLPLLALLLASPAAAAPPNILWISIEDTGVELGCYGDRYAVTPNIDRLAQEGVRFTRCFTHAPVCAPSRSGIITGMYPTTIGTHHMRSKGVPPPFVKCFPEYLRAAGYYCTNDSKTDYNFDAPLTAWDDNRAGAHWRNRPTKETPFFAVINLVSSHESQIRQPEASYAKVKAAIGKDWHDPAKGELPPYYPDTPAVRQDWARYYDVVTFTDLRIGKILAELEADGLAESTIVFFWGDHGRGLPRGKRWLYDSGTHVPLVVRMPVGRIGNPPSAGRIDNPAYVAANTTRDDLVCFLDLAPTVLALAGVEIPKHFQGQVILGPQTAPPREYVFGARDRMDETYDIIRSVRDKRFKYLRNYMPERTYAQKIEYMDLMPTMQDWRRLYAAGELKGPQLLFFRETKPKEELFDCDADPHEIHDLAGDPKYADTLARMRAVHERWMKETRDLGLVPEPELIERTRPGGKESVVATPVITVKDGHVTIACATEGVSIAYCVVDPTDPAKQPAPPKKNGQPAPRLGWKLYSQPFELPAGKPLEVRTVACRLGWKESTELSTSSPLEARMDCDESR